MSKIAAYHAIVGVGNNMVEINMDDFYPGDEVISALRGITGAYRAHDIIEALRTGCINDFNKFGVIGVRFVSNSETVCPVAKI